MRKLCALAFIAMLAAPLPTFAYTQADADARAPDAMRLCMHAVPDEGRVALCLLQNKQQLSSAQPSPAQPSPACTAAFSRPRDASVTRERPAKAQKTKF